MPGSTTRIISHTLTLLAGLSAGFLAYALINATLESQDGEYSIPNQPQRFARAKAANDIRVLDIDAVYNPSYARGRTVLITGRKLLQTFFVLMQFSRSICCFVAI